MPTSPISGSDILFRCTPPRVRFLLLFPKSISRNHTRKIMNATDQPPNNQLHRVLETVRQGAIAGAAGGLAEIAWVTLYAAATGANPAALARGVTTAAGLNSLLPEASVAMGVILHVSLAVTLGIALAFAWRKLAEHRAQTASPLAFMVVALSAVWAINFFVVLPIVSPAFTQLVPYSVSFLSKALFGVAAAGVFRLLAEPALKFNPARISRSAS
jgi:hypothetical protein